MAVSACLAAGSVPAAELEDSGTELTSDEAGELLEDLEQTVQGALEDAGLTPVEGDLEDGELTPPEGEKTFWSEPSEKTEREQIVEYALQFVGNPYVWGGTSLTDGADCSGFVLSVLSEFGYSLPRVAADQYLASLYRI